MSQPQSLNVEEILGLLPHRYPFLLVDRILSIEKDKRIVGIKNVSINEPFFQGHFPGRPIMPGVLIIEAMAQVGGILAFLSANQPVVNPAVYLMGVDKVRFRKPVTPGDQLVMELEVLRGGKKFWKMQAKAMVNDALAAEAEIMAAIDLEGE